MVGFIADSQFSGSTVLNGSQQQFVVRNSNLDGWTNAVWNQVFSGDVGAPAQNFGSGGQYTTLAASPVTAEAPLRLAEYVKIKHGLGDALYTAAAQDIVSETYRPVTGAIGELLRACEDAGSVRPGLDPGDVLLLVGCLWRVGPGEEGKAQATRLLDLIINSFRPAPAGRSSQRP